MGLRKTKADLDLDKCGGLLSSIATLSISRIVRTDGIRLHFGWENTRLMRFSASARQVASKEAEKQMDEEIIGDDFFRLVQVDRPMGVCEQRDPGGFIKKHDR